jgi:hypothetical protein
MLMFSLPPHPEKTIPPVAELARREAERSSPRFSNVLHARIMSAVETADTKPAGSDPIVPQPRNGSVPAAMMVIVFMGIAASVVVKFNLSQLDENHSVASHDSTQTVALTASVQLLNVSTVEAVPKQVGAALQTAMAEERWAGLDQDAKRVTRYLVDQVPFQTVWRPSESASGNSKTEN